MLFIINRNLRLVLYLIWLLNIWRYYGHWHAGSTHHIWRQKIRRLSKGSILHRIHHWQIWRIHSWHRHWHVIHLWQHIWIAILLLETQRNKVHILLVVNRHVLYRHLLLLFWIMLRHLLRTLLCLYRSLSLVYIVFFCSKLCLSMSISTKISFFTEAFLIFNAQRSLVQVICMS